MRTHGTLTRWNDDKGYGFVSPANGSADLFVHVSAFPRDGIRPRLNELISFEVEAGRDGKQRAVRVMRPGHRARVAAPARARRRPRGRQFGGILMLLALAVIGVYGYTQYGRHSVPNERNAPDIPMQLAAPVPHFSCDGRTRCPQMSSCEEAQYFLRNCPNTKMDGDRDGVPCEDQWCY